MARANNSNLHQARTAKNDEFYTDIYDVQAELAGYRHLFKGKSVLCNCNDGPGGAFYRYAAAYFTEWKAARVVTTTFVPGGHGVKYELTGDANGDGYVDNLDYSETPLEGNGDFRSPECVALLKQADIVIGNPPFSLFREYIDQLMEHGKELVIIGNINALTYKNVFGYIQANRLWTGNHHPKKFLQPDGSIKQLGNICWFTNMPVPKLLEPIELWRKYTPEMYPRYDNYDAINVNRVWDIPVDYPGVMGVPKTYLTVHCPAQFEIVGVDESAGKGGSCGLWDEASGVAQPLVNGQRRFSRVFIRHLNPEPVQP
jgi:hypothetical protein